MKNSTLITLVIALSILVLSSCSPNQYISENFDSETASHTSIAVIPVEMIFTGNIPNDMTDADVAAVEETESQAFQLSLHSSVLRSTRRGKRPMDVQMQSVRQTNSILKEAGIDLRTSWEMSPKELAFILGVDAVVVSKITKERYLSDAASYAIGVGVATAQQILGANPLPTPRGVTKTYDINVDVSAVNGQNGDVLFSNRKVVEINWTCTPEEAIERVNRKLTRNFPYSKKN